MQNANEIPAQERLRGKGFSVYGDSISTLGGHMHESWRIFYEGEAHVEGVTRPEDTWWGKVIDHFGGRFVTNASFSGAVVEGYGFPAGCSDERIVGLVGAQGEIPDVVLVLMGINDYGWGCGRNQVMGESPSASAKPDDLPGPKDVVGVVGPEQLARFQQKYGEMIAKIKSLKPDIEVWCATLSPGTVSGVTWPCFAYSIRGIEFDDYNKAIKAAAQENGAYVADIRAFGIDYDGVEGVHPTALGMCQMAEMFIAAMEGKSTDPDDYPLLAEAPRSTRACFKPNCDGCPHIDIRKEGWNLYCSKYGEAPAG